MIIALHKLERQAYSSPIFIVKRTKFCGIVMVKKTIPLHFGCDQNQYQVRAILAISDNVINIQCTLIISTVSALHVL